MNKTEQVIDRASDYLRLMRYNYTAQEKLSRLSILNDYYSTIKTTPNSEKFTITVECAEQLSSGNLKLPLKVRGVFLSEGRPKAKFYTKDELKRAVDNPINHSFPMALDHKDTEVEKIIGVVDKITYDDAISAIRWYGHINSELYARNVIDGAIKEVSVTVYSVSQYDNKLGLVGKDLTFKELSLVWKGQDPKNSIELDGSPEFH